MIDASSLYKLRKDAPPDGEALARRAESDFGPMIDALWGAGYYNATVSLGAASLTIASSDVSAFASAAESHRNRAVAPVIARAPAACSGCGSVCQIGTTCSPCRAISSRSSAQT